MSESRFSIDGSKSSSVITVVKDREYGYGEASAVYFYNHTHREDADAFVAMRNNPTPSPKFKVGDRVRPVSGPGELANLPFTIKRIEFRYEGPDAFGISHFDEDVLELAPPEPPKARWEVDPSGATGIWRIVKGPACVGALHTASLAQQVADLLNAQDEKES